MLLMKTNYIYLLIILLLLSCSKDNDVEPVVIKERTILAYLALDNSLSNEMNDVYESLMEGWSDDIDGSLLIFADARRAGNPKLIQFEERNGVVVADTLYTYENDNSASPELFRKVITDTKLIAPAKSYGLLLFSHATGWLPEGAFKNPEGWGARTSDRSVIVPRSIFEDKGREMELSDFAAAIPDGAFEFIASEMCFMSSVETAYALRNKTEYLLASAPEVLSPGFTPIYKTSLNLLYQSSPDLEGFAQEFFDYFNKQSGSYRSAAISVVRTSGMEKLASLTKAIDPQLTQDEIDQVQFFDRNGKPHLFFDFADYIRQAATPEQMAEIEEQLDKVVVFKRNTAKLININIVRHSGLSVYIPKESLPRLNEAYEETEWYRRVKN